MQYAKNIQWDNYTADDNILKFWTEVILISGSGIIMESYLVILYKFIRAEKKIILWQQQVIQILIVVLNGCFYHNALVIPPDVERNLTLYATSSYDDTVRESALKAIEEYLVEQRKCSPAFPAGT